MSKNEINLQNACFCVCKMQQYSAGCSSYNEVMILPEFCLWGPVLPTCLKKKTEYLGYNTYKPILSIPVLNENNLFGIYMNKNVKLFEFYLQEELA